MPSGGESDAQAEASIATIGKGVVYVSLAPMSRAHTHTHNSPSVDPSNLPHLQNSNTHTSDGLRRAAGRDLMDDGKATRNIQNIGDREGTNRDDGSWMNTSARPGLIAPQNTPWRGDASAALTASRWATASPTESPRVSQLSQASVDDSEPTVGSVLRLAGRGLVSKSLSGITESFGIATRQAPLPATLTTAREDRAAPMRLAFGTGAISCPASRSSVSDRSGHSEKNQVSLGFWPLKTRELIFQNFLGSPVGPLTDPRGMPHPVTATWETLSGKNMSIPTERSTPSDIHVPANDSASGRISSRGTGGRVSQLTANHSNFRSDQSTRRAARTRRTARESAHRSSVPETFVSNGA